MSDEDSFSTAAARLSDAFARDGAPMHSRDHEIVRSGLVRFLLARFRSLGVDELLDAVDEAVTRLLRESRRRGRSVENAGGWLVAVAKNLARDRLRRLANEPKFAEQPATDDDTARLLDQLTTKEAIRDGIARAVRVRDHVCVAVVTEWLDLATESGERPSSRAVATRCGCSHTTVNQALDRFHGYLAGK